VDIRVDRRVLGGVRWRKGFELLGELEVDDAHVRLRQGQGAVGGVVVQQERVQVLEEELLSALSRG
jgi:hypothetical protein